MKIRILSDLHLETCPFTLPKLPDDDETTLILAGDIGQINQRNILEPFLLEACARFRHIVYVMGNHEYYGGTFPESLERLKQWDLPANLHILEKTHVVLDGVNFAGATLWTDFNNYDARCIQACLTYLPDFQNTLFHDPAKEPDSSPVPLTPDHQYRAHQTTRHWLAEALPALEHSGRPTILVTHHGISWRSVLPKDLGLVTNGGIVSDLTGLLLDSPPALCIHGHTHDSFDYRLGSAQHGSRIMTNPRGIGNPDGSQENTRFNSRYCLTFTP